MFFIIINILFQLIKKKKKIINEICIFIKKFQKTQLLLQQ